MEGFYLHLKILDRHTARTKNLGQPLELICYFPPKHKSPIKAKTLYQGDTTFYQPVAHYPGCPVLPVLLLRVPEMPPSHRLFYNLPCTAVQTLLLFRGRSFYELSKSKSA